MIDPTPFQIVLGTLSFIVFIGFVIACVIGLSIRAARLAAKMNAGKLNAEVDARVLVMEDRSVRGDPTMPFSSYAAVNEAHEAIKRRR